jgi:CRISPR-associated endoribonuclease Cas6
MRIKVNYSKNTEKVPNNQTVVNSYVHNCLGRNNEYHDAPSNYCISRLLGGEIVDGGRNVEFPNGGYIIITSADTEFMNKIIMGILSNPLLGYSMQFESINHIEEKFYNGWNYFKTTNMGFILRRKDGENGGYHTLNDPDFAEVVKEHIMRKFSKINPGFDFNNLNVVINKHPSHKVETVYCKQIKNSTNICQISIQTNKKLAEAIYNYGIGQSTGSGFGTIYTTQHLDFYK